MSEGLPAAGPPTSQDRQRVEAELCEHFAAGHIDLDELEHRLGIADTAPTPVALDELVRDLQPLPASPPVSMRQPARRGWALALMGGSGRKGKWLPPRNLNAVAVMGGVDLDFREARLAPGVTHVMAIAVMGGVDIIVPPDLPVTVRGLGVMGAVDQVEHIAEGSGPNTPELRVTALACMGGVEVKTRARAQTEQLISSKRGERKR